MCNLVVWSLKVFTLKTSRNRGQGRWLSGLKYLMWKHEDLSSDQQHLHKSWVWYHVPQTPLLEGSRDFCPDRLANKGTIGSVSFSSVRDPGSTNTGDCWLGS